MKAALHRIIFRLKERKVVIRKKNKTIMMMMRIDETNSHSFLSPCSFSFCIPGEISILSILDFFSSHVDRKKNMLMMFFPFICFFVRFFGLVRFRVLQNRMNE